MSKLDRHLPRWIARDQRDRDSMEAWVNRMLEVLDSEEWEYNAEEMNARAAEAAKPGSFEKFKAWLDGDGQEIAEAERGNIQPLRDKYPHLARFLHRPKQPGRGRRFPKNDVMSDPDMLNLTMAVWDVSRIRAIWYEHYKRKNRPLGQLSAEEIAARRWNVKEHHVRAWMKSSACPEDPLPARRAQALS